MSSDNSQLDPGGSYGYVPDLATAIAFLAIFLISTLLHLYQIFGRKPRIMPWMVVFPICGLLELIGWGGRLWSHFAIHDDGFLMQIVCLVIAPTFMSAGLYMLLGVLIQHISPETSYLSGKWFKITFMVADIVSLVVQAVGGGMAASATLPDDVELGGQIMLGGICFQLFVMLVYVVYGFVWWSKSRSAVSNAINRISGGDGIKKAILGMTVCSAMIIVRGFYRSVELGDGFDGKLAQTELLFLLDAIPVAIAMYIVNALPPNYHLQCLYRSGTDSERAFNTDGSNGMVDMGEDARAERGDFSRTDTLIGEASGKNF